MLFNSFEFILLLLPATYCLWFIMRRLGKTMAALNILLLASLCFYAWWNPPYIFLLLASIVFNYILQNKITHNGSSGNLVYDSKVYLSIGIFANLALIGYFKYANFFADNLAYLLNTSWNMRNIFLPLGISFFTFQQIACLVDTYKGKIGSLKFYEYALFVTFFPQLIAGPIVKADEIIPQFKTSTVFHIDHDKLQFGLCLFAFGLFKKTAIADSFSPVVALVFDTPSQPFFLDSFTGTLAYTLQIYFDFSGYSDMALGLGNMFGIDLPINFDSPYKSASIIDFWRTWHITLSHFLRDYLYIPLGGNRNSAARKYFNLMVTMLLGGLWHGAGWGFVFWGGLHGFYLVINNIWRKHPLLPLPKVLCWCITFPCVCFAWIFFRAKTFGRALDISRALFNFTHISAQRALIIMDRLDSQRLFISLIAATLICFFFPNSYNFLKRNQRRHLSLALFGGLVLATGMWVMTYSTRVSEFLYFQF